MNKYIVAMFVPLALAACASPVKQDTSKPPVSQEKVPAPAAQNESPANTGNASAADTEAGRLADRARLAREMATQLKKESVYFDFDKSEVKSEFQGVVKKQADFLLTNGNDTVTLEGNCDERGSDEYNLALGDRRASAVSRQLQVLGVAQGRIKTVSYGEEKPRLTCHEEKCWKENRRVDFTHQLN